MREMLVRQDNPAWRLRRFRSASNRKNPNQVRREYPFFPVEKAQIPGEWRIFFCAERFDQTHAAKRSNPFNPLARKHQNRRDQIFDLPTISLDPVSCKAVENEQARFAFRTLFQIPVSIFSPRTLSVFQILGIWKGVWS